MSKTVSIGNKGKGIRSDCSVTLEITESGGISLQLESKVKVLYGKQIEKLALDILAFYSVKNAKLLIEDSGALPLVTAARLEAAIRKLTESEKEYLLPVLPQNQSQTTHERNRISRLYLPGNSPSLMINAGIHHPDGIILDLEDAVAPDKKYEASFLVRNALRGIDFYGAERMVRINQIPRGLDDLPFIVNHGVNLILVPKCESAEQIKLVNKRISEIIDDKKRNIWLMPIIESAEGVLKAYEIATAAPNVVALVLRLLFHRL